MLTMPWNSTFMSISTNQDAFTDALSSVLPPLLQFCVRYLQLPHFVVERKAPAHDF